MIRFGVHGRGRQGHAVVCVVVVCAAFVAAYLFFRQSESVDVSHRSIFEDAKRVVFAKFYPRYSTEFATRLPDPSQTREGNASTWIDMDAKSSDSEGLWKWDGEADASVEPLHDWTPPIQEVESIRERDFSPVSPAVAVNETSKTEIATNKIEMENATDDTHVRSAGLSLAKTPMNDFDSPIREVVASTVASPASDAPASDTVAKSDTDTVKSSTVASSDLVASASDADTIASQKPIQSISVPPALLDMAPRYPVKDLTASLARDEIGTATAIGTTAVGANVVKTDVAAVKHTASFGSGARESEKTAEPVSSASSPSVSSVPENQTIWRSTDDVGTTPPLSTERDVGGANQTDETKKASMGDAANRATVKEPASPWNVSEDPLPTNATRTENGVQFSSVKTGANVYNSRRTMERDTGVESAGLAETASKDSAVYHVYDGDTLESIAKRSGVASAELLYQWNQDRIADPELLPIGMELRLARP